MLMHDLLTSISEDGILISLADITLNDVSADDKRRHIMSEIQERSPLTEAVFYILLALMTPLHGYGIMQQVKEMSAGRVSLGAGTLYGAINTMLERGWIIPDDKETDSRKKAYQITVLGRSRLETEMERLQELLDQGKKMLEGTDEKGRL